MHSKGNHMDYYWEKRLLCEYNPSKSLLVCEAMLLPELERLQLQSRACLGTISEVIEHSLKYFSRVTAGAVEWRPA